MTANRWRRGRASAARQAERGAGLSGYPSLLLLAFACATGPDEDPNKVDTVEVQPGQYSLYLEVQPQVQLNLTARNKAGTVVTDRIAAWRSSAAGVATVSSTGAVTAVGLGTASITAAIDGVEGSATITVLPPPVASVTLDLDAGVLIVGGSTAAAAVVRDARGNELTDRQVTFASSDLAVATVSPIGEVMALASGTSTITASAEGKSSALTLCVVPTAPNLRLDNVLVTQASQRGAGDIPLVIRGLPAEIQAFATSDMVLPAGCQVARVRFIVYQDQTEVARSEVDAAGQLPLVANIDAPTARFVVESELITAALRILVDVDPQDRIPEPDGSDNVWPATGIPGSPPVIDVPPLELRFVPIFLANGGSTGDVHDGVMDEYLFATRQLYPISSIDWEIGETMSTNAEFGTGGSAAWVQMLGELDVRRVAEASKRYYVGSVRPPPGVTFTQVGGIGYVPFNLASSGQFTRTSLVVGVGWFARERQTTEVVAHELGHNHGRRHAPCGGPSNPDAQYPYDGATIGVPGTDMYSYAVNGGKPLVLSPFSNFDIMSYCTPAWISDYNYAALLNARLIAGPVAARAAGPSCDCLIVWGAVHRDSVTLNPAFVTRTSVQLPSKTGTWVVEGIREDGGTAFSYPFEPSEIDHAPDVRHFTFAIPLSDSDRSSLAELRVQGPGGAGVLGRRRSAVGATAMRIAAGEAALRLSTSRAVTALQYPTSAFRGVLVRNAATGAVLGVSTTGTVTLPGNVAEVDVTLSDGVRSETVRVRQF